MSHQQPQGFTFSTSPAPTTPKPQKPHITTPTTQTHTAKIIQWDHQKGFGYLLHNKQKLFLHRRDFSEYHKKPSPGDIIHFNIGKDSKGRICATNATHKNDGGRLTLTNILLLIPLLFLPIIALYKLQHLNKIPLTIIPLAIITINILTYFAYEIDKAKARAKAWRTPESTLQFLALIGGWPAAYIAQKRLRHKCSKSSFQFIFWLTITLHQLTAFDYIKNWKYSNIAIKELKESLNK